MIWDISLTYCNVGQYSICNLVYNLMTLIPFISAVHIMWSSLSILISSLFTTQFTHRQHQPAAAAVLWSHAEQTSLQTRTTVQLQLLWSCATLSKHDGTRGNFSLVLYFIYTLLYIDGELKHTNLQNISSTSQDNFNILLCSSEVCEGQIN